MVRIGDMSNCPFIESKSDLKKEIQPGFTLAITERRDPAMNLILGFESEHVWECALADDFLSLEKILRYSGDIYSGDLRMKKMWQKAGIIIQRKSRCLNRKSRGVSDELLYSHHSNLQEVSGSPLAKFLLPPDPHRTCSHERFHQILEPVVKFLRHD